MKVKIESELRMTNYRIQRAEDKVQNLLEDIQELAKNPRDIIVFMEGKVQRLKELNEDIERLTENRKMLEYFLEER